MNGAGETRMARTFSAPADTLESVGDTLRLRGWEIAVDPGKKEGPKLARPGDKMVVLRPTHSKQPAPIRRQAKSEIEMLN
jgi:hypothetical protein